MHGGWKSLFFELLNIQYILLHKDLLDIIEMHESETTGELTEFERKKRLSTFTLSMKGGS